MSIGISFLYQFSLGQYNNTTPGSNIISITSQASGDHSKINLTTTPLRQTWRSTSTANQVIVMQVNDETTVPDMFALLNHNLTSTAVVNIKGSMTTNFSGATFNVNIPYNKTHLVLYSSAGQAWKYYQFTIMDAGNPYGYIELGRIIAGKAFIFQNDEDIADAFTFQNTDLAYQMPTEGYFRASNERVKIGGLSINFPKIKSRVGENANFVGLRNMFLTTGMTYPFLTIIDPNDVYFKLLWGQLTKLPNEQYDINRYVSIAMDIQEVY